MASDAGPALRAAARIGPYFTWQPWDGEPGWRPLTDLLDDGVVTERVEAGRRALAAASGSRVAAVGEREAASIVFLGLASRLLSPLLAAATAGGALPVPDRDRMWWRPVERGPVPIAGHGLVATDCADQDAAAIAGALTRTATRGLVEPVLAVFRRRFSVSPQVLWGNVASALGGAATVLAGHGYAERSAAVVGHALSLPPLRGTATLTGPDPRGRRVLVRRNCCLYYRIPGGGICGDCVLAPSS